jgi:hypothetical protein
MPFLGGGRLIGGDRESPSFANMLGELFSFGQAKHIDFKFRLDQ